MIPTDTRVTVRKNGRGAGNGELGEVPKIVQSRGEKMKKLVVSIGACLLLTSGLGAAKDTTFKGEIMDEACADDGGHESMFKKMGTNDPKVCTEACVKGGSKYVLFNAD